MMNKHKLLQKKHSYFLSQNRQDPITGDTIQENDTVVICAICKSTFLIDSWKYIDEKHCGQSLTLKKIPKEKHIFLGQKNTPKKIVFLNQKKDKTDKNTDYRSTVILTVGLIPVILYAFFIINYVDINNRSVLLGGVFVTVMISLALIKFVNGFYPEE